MAVNESRFSVATLLVIKQVVLVHAETVFRVLHLEAAVVIRVKEHVRPSRSATTSPIRRALQRALAARQEASPLAQGIAGLLSNAINRVFLIRAGNAIATATMIALIVRNATQMESAYPTLYAANKTWFGKCPQEFLEFLLQH